MFPKMFHPRTIRNALDWNGSAKFFSRTIRPPKYYFIDYGLSLQFDPKDGPALAPPIEGGDKSVPEFQDPSGWYERDPYPTDVYYVGNVIRNKFLQVESRSQPLEFVAGVLTPIRRNIQS